MAAGRPAYQQVILADGPYAYWRLNETSGTVAADSSGNGRDGSYVGGFSLASAALVPSTDEEYAALDGSTGYVNITPAANFCAGTDWTIEMWVNFAAMGAKGASLLCFFALTGFSFYASGNGIDYQPKSGYAASAWAGLPLAVGTPKHIVLSARGANYAGTLYFNAAAHTGSSVYAPGISTLLGIGLPSSYMNYMNGCVGEVALYDHALSAQQVRNHWLAGA
ncbi:hypothetical protein R75461_08423 [Paraburkholderia nemoris]|uniref:LamG-like jellyroll fold domain-containing protein n=1 Tax=Paraburkholderia nemoris TaxID=2793076 RepID=UPI001909D334|nr:MULTISPECIES: LamG-like jellyroll fold domain-containing protein [Paraburkholderia]MBK3787193.1 LamG domain-containing protein [Paraburkholderia aspalathi]CAE6868353.1 hypothetical protein R75461_08423 [Paraburkholderia nemoris]